MRIEAFLDIAQGADQFVIVCGQQLQIGHRARQAHFLQKIRVADAGIDEIALIIIIADAVQFQPVDAIAPVKNKAGRPIAQFQHVVLGVARYLQIARVAGIIKFDPLDIDKIAGKLLGAICGLAADLQLVAIGASGEINLDQMRHAANDCAVKAFAAVYLVTAIAQDNFIVARATLNAVITQSADQRIVASPPIQSVVASTAAQEVIAAIAS